MPITEFKCDRWRCGRYKDPIPLDATFACPRSDCIGNRLLAGRGPAAPVAAPAPPVSPPPPPLPLKPKPWKTTPTQIGIVCAAGAICLVGLVLAMQHQDSPPAAPLPRAPVTATNSYSPPPRWPANTPAHTSSTSVAERTPIAAATPRDRTVAAVTPEPPAPAVVATPAPAPAAEVPAPATPSIESIRNRIASLIVENLRFSNERNVEALVSLRAARVDYFDDGFVDLAYIRSDMTKYFQKWPIGLEELVAPMRITQGKSANEMVAEFRTHFRVQNLSGEFIEGDNDNVLTVDIEDGGLKISGEKSHVTNRRKGVVSSSVAASPNVALPQPSQQSSHPNPVPSHSESDSSRTAAAHLYKLPELKTLAGKRLQNAYLSGSFICLSAQGPDAVLQSYNDTPFVGPATTQQAESLFQQGFLYVGNTEVRVTFSRGHQLHRGMALHFSADSPLKIISVSTTLGGHYRVIARYDD